MTRVAILAAVISSFGLASIGAPGFAYDLDPVTTAPPVAAPSQLSLPTTPAPAPVVPETAEPSADMSTPSDADLVVAPKPAPSHASLADALAAQTIPEQLTEDAECLATAIYFEAKGEPLSGQLAVAKVIINRAASGRFARSICSVVTQPGQFSFVKRGVLPPAPRAAPAFRVAAAMAQLALSDGWKSPADTALFFHARHVAPGWRGTRIAAIGNHIFYR